MLNLVVRVMPLGVGVWHLCHSVTDLGHAVVDLDLAVQPAAHFVGCPGRTGSGKQQYDGVAPALPYRQDFLDSWTISRI